MVQRLYYIIFVIIGFPYSSLSQIKVENSTQCVILEDVSSQGDITIIYSPQEELMKIQDELKKNKEIRAEVIKLKEELVQKQGYLESQKNEILKEHETIESHKQELEKERKEIYDAKLKIKMMIDESRAEINMINSIVKNKESLLAEKEKNRVNDLLSSANQILQNSCLFDDLEVEEIIDEKGRKQIGFNREDIENLGFFLIGERFHEGMAKVCRSNKCGFIDTTGKVAIRLIYDDVKPFNNGISAVKNNNEWSLINREGKTISSTMYVNVFDLGREGSRITVAKSKNELLYIIGNNGKEISKGYKEPWYFMDVENSESLIIVDTIRFWGSYGQGIINKKGKEVFSPKYRIEPLHNSKNLYTIVNRKNNTFRVINSTGILLTKSISRTSNGDEYRFQEGYIISQSNCNKSRTTEYTCEYKLYDLSGKEIQLPFKTAAGLKILSPIFGSISKGYKSYLFDIRGGDIIGSSYFDYRSPNFLLNIYDADKSIYKLTVNYLGKEKIESRNTLIKKSEYYEHFFDDYYSTWFDTILPPNRLGHIMVMATVGNETEIKIYDLLSNKILDFKGSKFSWIKNANELNHYIAYKGYSGGFFLYDEKGKQVFEKSYDYIGLFSEGLYPVKESKFGYLDRKGKIVISFKYTNAEPFQDGFAIVGLNDKYGLITKDDYQLLPPFCDKIEKIDVSTFKIHISEEYIGYKELVLSFDNKTGNCTDDKEISKLYYELLKKLNKK